MLINHIEVIFYINVFPLQTKNKGLCMKYVFFHSNNFFHLFHLHGSEKFYNQGTWSQFQQKTTHT